MKYINPFSLQVNENSQKVPKTYYIKNIMTKHGINMIQPRGVHYRQVNMNTTDLDVELRDTFLLKNCTFHDTNGNFINGVPDRVYSFDNDSVIFAMFRVNGNYYRVSNDEPVLVSPKGKEFTIEEPRIRWYKKGKLE